MFSFWEEFMNLKRLGDSLLARSTKLNDLIAKIECEIADKEEETPETKRANKFKPQKTCFFQFATPCLHNGA